MPTVPYKIDNKNIPSVTTILSRFKDSEGLKIWSNNIGLKGISYREELKRTGNIGTIFHDHVESYITKKEFTLSDDPEVQSCFRGFLKWWKKFYV